MLKNFAVIKNQKKVMKVFSISVGKDNMNVSRFTIINETQIKEINELIAFCEKADQAPVHIQFDKSLNFFPRMNSWYLCYADEALVGVISVFAPQNHEAEITACVLPERRRQGIFSVMLNEAYEELNKYGIKRILLVNDRRSEQGKEVVSRKGYVYKHTEYKMRYENNEQAGSGHKYEIEVREAGENDLEAMIKVNISAFGGSYEDSKSFICKILKSNKRKQYVAILENHIIGICSWGFAANEVSINGLGVLAEYQGKGYGKELLAMIIDIIVKEKYGYEIILDVDSVNVVAYGLYKKMGFREDSAVDYYINLDPASTFKFF